jgi:tetratricopeptide (TPR) repeat protein
MNIRSLHIPAAAAALIALCGWLCACGPTLSEARPERIVRRTGGVIRVGRFVSPYCYEWFIRAELFALRGDWERAVEAYRMALAGPDEEDPLVMARLAEAMDRQGREQAALEVLDTAARMDPESEAVWLARARIAKRHGRTESAIEAYERAARSAPTSARPVLELARLLREKGAQERAIAVLERFEKRSDRGGADAACARLDLAISRGDAEGAGRAVDRLLRVAPLETEQVRQAARLTLDSGRPVLAAALMDHIPRDDRDNALRLRILLRAGRLAEAEQLLAVGTPDSFGGLVPTAQAYLQVGRPQIAEQLAGAALGSDPSPLAQQVAAQANLALGRYARAAELFVRVPPAAPGFAAARIGLARALAASGLPALGAETLAAVRPKTPAICAELRAMRSFAGIFGDDPLPAPGEAGCPVGPPEE